MEKMKKDTHKDCLPSSQRRDNNDAFKLVDQFRRYHVIQMENMHELFSLTTGDVASEDILKDPINAADSGEKIVNEFVKKKKRLSTRLPQHPYPQKHQNILKFVQHR